MISTRALVIVLFAGLGCPSCCNGPTPPRTTNWPVEPINSAHALGHSMGQFQNVSTIYQHSGIDILTKPATGNGVVDIENAPWVIATVGGQINCNSSPGGTFNQCNISGDDGVLYIYMHLYVGISDANAAISSNSLTHVDSGQHISQVAPWTSDGVYHHLHYEMFRDGKYINPLLYITPHSDENDPVIEEVYLARRMNDHWMVFESTMPVQDQNGTATSCTSVEGIVDIVVKSHDRDNANSTSACAQTATIGVYDLKWRLCPIGTPNCTEWHSTYKFDEMPLSWHDDNNANTLAQFSTISPFFSETGYCNANSHYLIPTHWANGILDESSHLNTSRFSNGSYLLTVVASDISGRSSTFPPKRVCISNGEGAN